MADLICQCGCGEIIPPKPSHRRYTPRYIQSHFLRISVERRAATRRATNAARRRLPDGWCPPSGVCECGCGESTPIARVTRRERNQFVGHPLRFVNGHNSRGISGPAKNTWKGGRYRAAAGYVFVYAPDHPHAIDGYVLEHRLVYEATHGVILTPSDIIHHVNGVRDDNRHENLVRTTRAGHAVIHQKLPAFRLDFPERAKEHARTAGIKGGRARWGQKKSL